MEPSLLGNRGTSVMSELKSELTCFLAAFVLVVGVTEDNPEKNPEEGFEIVRIIMIDVRDDGIQQVESYEVIRPL